MRLVPYIVGEEFRGAREAGVGESARGAKKAGVSEGAGGARGAGGALVFPSPPEEL